MSKQFDELTRDLAKGVSRRSALWRFVTGVGAAAAGVVFSQKKAQAQNPVGNCATHCAKCYEGFEFKECMAVSAACELFGECAVLEGGFPIAGVSINGRGGIRWYCTELYDTCGAPLVPIG